MEAAEEVKKELDNITLSGAGNGDFYQTKHFYVKNLKKAVLLLLTGVHEKFQRKLVFEEEIMMNIADMLMSVYIFESTLLRVEKLEKNALKTDIKPYRDILDVLAYDSMQKAKTEAIAAVSSYLEGDEKKKMLSVMETLTGFDPVNVKEARRRIADKLIDDTVYKF
jgi:hypothetical protein